MDLELLMENKQKNARSLYEVSFPELEPKTHLPSPLQLEPDHVAQPFNQMCSGVISMGLKGMVWNAF